MLPDKLIIQKEKDTGVPMKHIALVMLILTAFCLLQAQDSPLNSYLENPNSATFEAAYNFVGEQLASDSTAISYRLLQAQLAAMEASRLIDEVTPQAPALDASGKFQFANLLLSLNRFDDAIGYYNELNRDFPAWSCPWRHKGTALYNLKQYKDAEKSLQQAVQTNAEHYDAYIWLAKTQYQLKKYKPALKNLETALTLNPEAEESMDEAVSEESIRALHDELLKKNHKSRP